MTTSGWDSRHSRSSAPSASRRPSSASPTGRSFSRTRRLDCCKALTCSSMALPCFRVASTFGSPASAIRVSALACARKRKQIGPELIMQLARDFLALDVLQRDNALGQTPLVVDRIAQRGGKVIQLVANGGEFRRAIRLHARVVAAGFDLRHRLRKRLDRCERPADDPARDEEKHDRNRRADLELGDDAVPDLGHLVVRMRRDQQRHLAFP